MAARATRFPDGWTTSFTIEPIEQNETKCIPKRANENGRQSHIRTLWNAGHKRSQRLIVTKKEGTNVRKRKSQNSTPNDKHRQRRRLAENNAARMAAHNPSQKMEKNWQKQKDRQNHLIPDGARKLYEHETKIAQRTQTRTH